MFHLADQQGFQDMLARSIAQRGTVLLVGGHTEEGITQLREVSTRNEHVGGEVLRTVRLADLAVGYGMVGRLDEGFAVLVEAMALCGKHRRVLLRSRAI